MPGRTKPALDITRVVIPKWDCAKSKVNCFKKSGPSVISITWVAFWTPFHPEDSFQGYLAILPSPKAELLNLKTVYKSFCLSKVNRSVTMTDLFHCPDKDLKAVTTHGKKYTHTK